MSGSLKEQLIKLGLGRDKPPEPRPRARDKRPSHVAPPPRSTTKPTARETPRKPAPASSAPSAREQREIERERARRQARVFAQLETHKLDDATAEIKHYYSTGRKIKYTYVTEAQQQALLAGEIVIVVAQGKGRLVPNSLLPSLREIDPELRVVDPHAAATASDDEDPEHQIPDDLRW